MNYDDDIQCGGYQPYSSLAPLAAAAAVCRWNLFPAKIRSLIRDLRGQKKMWIMHQGLLMSLKEATSWFYSEFTVPQEY